MKIRFCEQSPKGKSRLAKQLAAEFPGLDIKIKGCCKQCKTCREMPIATLDKQLVTGDSWEQLWEKLVAAIQGQRL